MAISKPVLGILLIVVFIAFFSLIIQNWLFGQYCNVLDDIARAFLLKPMEESGGLTNSIYQEFQEELSRRNISPDSVVLKDATWYPVDRGEPVEIILTSEFSIKALAYVGGPVIKRPVIIRKVGVSQEFFR